MQSFIFQADSNKNNSVQKSSNVTPSVSVNPFFQYVTNNRPLIPPQFPKDNVIQAVTSNTLLNIQGTSNQRKNSETLADPRKNHIFNHQQQNSHSSNKLDNSQFETKTSNENLKQRRSRSRQNRVSKNRQNSQEGLKNQKKEEHFHKTKLCPLFDKGECKKGSQCHFAHGFKDLRGLPNFYKTRLCLSFEKGQCKKSSIDCKYAHGQKQLRSLKHDAGYSNTISNLSNQNKSNRNNDNKLRDNQDRKSLNDDRHNKNHNRNNREDKNSKNRKERESESEHRKDRNRRQNQLRQESRDRRKNTQKKNDDPLSYKKNLPLNKQYQKFLYGDSKPIAPEVDNSLYMVPNPALYSNPNFGYSQDPYSINQKVNYENFSQIAPSSVSQSKNYLPYEKQYQQNPNRMYNLKDQTISQPYYQKNTQMQNKVTYNFRQNEGHYQKNNYPQLVYPSPVNSQTYNQQYPSSYKPNSEFISDFSKDSYKNFSKSGLNDQSYSNVNRSAFSKDQRFSESFGYGQIQRNMSSGLPVNQFVGKQQVFYNKESYYSVPQSKVPENNFAKQVSPNTYPITYSSNYSNGGVYDLYPALDTSVNQSMKNSYSYEKSRYGSFSNNIPK